MNRITEVEIAGSLYPLNFSTKAYKSVEERYGGLDGINEALKGQCNAKMLDEINWLLALLIEQGAAYRKIMDGEGCKTISESELEVVTSIYDAPVLKTAIYEALLAGAKREVEVEADPKNAETTQDD